MWSSLIGKVSNTSREEEEEDESFHDPQQTLSPMQSPGGRLMGTFTRLIKEVTQPEDDGDDDYDGYGDEQQGWGEDDDDILESDEEEETSASSPPSLHPEPPFKEEEEEEAWAEAHEKTPQQDPESITPTTSNPHSPTAPENLVREHIQQVQQNLQTVLDQIDEQEDKIVSASLDEDDLNDDIRHCDTAIQEIQNELQQMNGTLTDSNIVDQLPICDEAATGDTTDQVEYPADPSVQVFLDPETIATGTMQNPDEMEVYEEENEESYLPVVDHTPPARPSPFARHDSLAVQALQMDQDIEENDAMDETVEENANAWSDDEAELEELDATESPLEEEIVDQLPNAEDRPQPIQRVASTGALPSMGDTVDIEEDDEKDMDDAHDFGPVVDHLPPTPAPPPSCTQSLAVMTAGLDEDFKQDDAMDETCYGGSTTEGVSGWGDDDVPELEDFSEEPYDGEPPTPPQARKTRDIRSPDFGDHVVDHTPSELDELPPTDPSVLVLATEEDISRDTGNGNDEEVYDDENELEYGPVVDLTPQTPDPSKAMSGANSLAVQGDEALDETLFGDSTIGGTVDADDTYPLDDDNKRPDSRSGHRLPRPKQAGGSDMAVVDHTPSEIGSPRPSNQNNDPSVEVLAPEEPSKSSVDADSVDDDQQYGPVVDQTPTTPAAIAPPNSASIIVQALDLDTADESFVESEDVEEEDKYTADEDLPSALRSGEAKLVDYIPPRPESRLGDASVLVAAEPSEVHSEVDDMAQEEECNFGPVVDQTPETEASPVPAPSGAASTAVFASPSVATDDLDYADETEGAAEVSEWENDVALLEETPNPQSGNNDEPLTTRFNEQLVDFLPPPDEAADMNEETHLDAHASSEVTVGGAQSLLQAEDPKEDDFGPVVDQTPVPSAASRHPSGMSLASTITVVTASECRAMEKEDAAEGSSAAAPDESENLVDHLPRMQDRNQVDSTATVARSQLSEDEEEDDSKFGPVVDHLPTPRASVAPSRGGSTVDALATVSEVDSDEDESHGDGWDDGDIDTSIGGVSDGTAIRIAAATRQALRRGASGDQERTVSVRFDSSANETRSVDGSSSLDNTHYYDPETLKSVDQNETQYFDPDSAEATWDDGLDFDTTPIRGVNGQHYGGDRAFYEADTPPSTPYRKPEPTNLDHLESNLNKLTGTLVLPDVDGTAACERCMGAKTTDCPCIRRLIQTNSDNGALIASLQSPEGVIIQVDFNRLLEDEILKRRLVEEECAVLKAANESRNRSSTREAELRAAVSNVEEAKKVLETELLDVQEKCAKLKVEKEDVECALETAKNSLEKLDDEHKRIVAKQSASETEIDHLKRSLEESTSLSASGDKELAQKVASLQLELAAKIGEVDELQRTLFGLKTRLAEVESESNRGKAAVRELEEKLHVSEEMLKESRKASLQVNSEYITKISVLETQISSSKAANASLAKQLADLQIQHEDDMNQQYNLLELKSSEYQSLEALRLGLERDKASLAAELANQRALARQSEALAQELLSVAKERDLLQEYLDETKEAVAQLQKHIDEHGMEREALDAKRQSELMELRESVREGESALSQSRQNLKDVSLELDREKADKHHLMSELQSLQVLVDQSKQEVQNVTNSLADAEARLQETANELASTKSKLDETIKERDDAVEKSYKANQHLADLGDLLKRTEGDAERLAARELELQSDLEKSLASVEKLQKEIEMTTNSLRDMERRYNEMELHYTDRLSETQREADERVARLEEELSAANERIKVLEEEKNNLRAAVNDEENKRAVTEQELEATRTERDHYVEENEEMLVQFGLLKENMDESELHVKELEQDIARLQSELNEKNAELESNALALEISAKQQDSVVTDLLTKLEDLTNLLQLSEVEKTNLQEEFKREIEGNIQKLEALEESRSELEQRCASQASVLTELLHTAEQLRVESSLNVELKQQLAELEQQCAFSQSEIHNLQVELHRVTEAHAADMDAEQARVQEEISSFRERESVSAAKLSEVQSLYEEACTELITANHTLHDLRNALNSKEEAYAALLRNLDSRVTENASMTDRIHSLECKAENLEAELSDKRMSLAKLQAKADELEFELELRSPPPANAEDELHAESQEPLEERVQSLSHALQSTRSRLSAKDEYISRLEAEVSELRGKSSKETAAQALHDVVLETSDISSLRSHVVSLAVALERSENRRAEAIDRLLSEREANAATLRRLSESVKRFYSSVSLGET